MSRPQRSLRLQRRSSDSLNILSGASGELFFDADLGALRLYTNNNNDRRILADRTWVTNNTFDGNYNNLTNTPVIPTVNGLATETYVDDAIAALPGVDLTGLATETYVDDAIAALPGVDLTGLATENYVDTAVSSVTATSIGLGNVTNESKATLFTSPTFTGTTTLQQSTELLNTKTSATGTVTHDFSTGAIWYHSSISANFTANFTNVPITADRAISVVLILVQGATPYIPNAVQIDGAVQTINWSGATAPTGNASQIDTVSFTFIRISDSWTVIGSLTYYG